MPSFFIRKIMLMETLILIVAMLLVLKNVNWARSSAVGHSNRALVIACEDELSKLTEEQRKYIENDLGFHIRICGVGKVNAALCAMWLRMCGIDTIVNVGTAGSHIYGKGTLVIPNQAAQRDMDATDIMRQFIPDYPKHRTPFEESIFKKIDLTHWVIPDDVRVVVGSDENPVTCWTGDNTHAYTEKSDIMDGAVIEMEGYSFAKLSINEHRKGTFQQKTLLIKCISDDGDENVGEQWAENADGIPWDDVISILDANYN
ncbi:MAG: hypothetical protein CMB45_04850 [Euryarchaeota archaeon]|nr:hypothetical protein [Euryarchaeota archaeon]